MTTSGSFNNMPLPIPALAAGGAGGSPPNQPPSFHLPPGFPVPFAQDLLRGAEEIAEFLYGSRTLRRRIFHLAETSQLPVFRLGSMICARRSVLMRWVEEQEQRSVQQPKLL